MSDKFKTDMTIEELVNYIRWCPKQFVGALPDKLQKYLECRVDINIKYLVDSGVYVRPANPLLLEQHNKEEIELAVKQIRNSPLIPIQSPDEQLRTEIATQIMVKHAPHSAMNMEMLADYCVEGADELLKRLKR